MYFTKYGQIIISYLFLLLFGVTSFAATTEQQQLQSSLMTPAKAVECVACHEKSGNSINVTIPKIAGLSYDYLVKQMHEYKLGDKGKRFDPVMYSIVANLSAADINELSAFYASHAMSQEVASNDNIELGEKIYRVGNAITQVTACTPCHMQNGQGNAWAGFPALAGQHTEYLITQLHKFKDSTRANDLNGIMQTIAKRMTDEEIEAVSNYISGLR